MSTQSQNKSKTRLGRGLSSLLSASNLPIEAEIPAGLASTGTNSPAAAVGVASDQTAAPLEIEISQIAPNPHQPRKRMSEPGLAELAASMKAAGVIQPVIVRRTDAGYQLIAGERRLRAAQLAGLTKLPAIVRAVDAFTQAQMALIENIQREDLNPIDRAQAYRLLMGHLGLTQSELATRLGEDRSSIANYVRLLDLSEPVRQLVQAGRISLGHAKLLAGVEDPIEQLRVANLCVTQELSVRNLERLLSGDGSAPASRAPGVSAHLLDLEKTIARQLGMRVQVRSGRKGRGRLVVHYASLDQFDDLLRRLGVQITE
jgi:ParB family transcriptional regulator, chromosome partitioning protein